MIFSNYLVPSHRYPGFSSTNKNWYKKCPELQKLILKIDNKIKIYFLNVSAMYLFSNVYDDYKNILKLKPEDLFSSDFKGKKIKLWETAVKIGKTCDLICSRLTCLQMVHPVTDIDLLFYQYFIKNALEVTFSKLKKSPHKSFRIIDQMNALRTLSIYKASEEVEGRLSETLAKFEILKASHKIPEKIRDVVYIIENQESQESFSRKRLSSGEYLSNPKKAKVDESAVIGEEPTIVKPIWEMKVSVEIFPDWEKEVI